MTSTPHDAFFKAVFGRVEHAAAMVRRLCSPNLSADIDWATMRPMPGSFVDPHLAKYHTDLLFSVLIAGRLAYIYYLLEHQSTSVDHMPLRILRYLVRIWDSHGEEHPDGPLPLIISIVISNTPGGWKGPLSFHELFDPHPSEFPGVAELTPHFTFILEDLSAASNEEIKSWTMGAFGKAALFALRDARDPEKLLRDFEHWGAFVARAARAPSGLDAVRLLMRYLAIASPNLNFEKFCAKIHEHVPQAEAEIMTIYEQALQQGQQLGLQQGQQQGRVALLAKLLTMKFGELPHEYQVRLAAATDEDIDRYSERLLTADTLAAVFRQP